MASKKRFQARRIPRTEGEDNFGNRIIFWAEAIHTLEDGVQVNVKISDNLDGHLVFYREISLGDTCGYAKIGLFPKEMILGLHKIVLESSEHPLDGLEILEDPKLSEENRYSVAAVEFLKLSKQQQSLLDFLVTGPKSLIEAIGPRFSKPVLDEMKKKGLVVETVSKRGEILLAISVKGFWLKQAGTPPKPGIF